MSHLMKCYIVVNMYKTQVCSIIIMICGYVILTGGKKQVPVFSYNKVKESKIKQYVSLLLIYIG